MKVRTYTKAILTAVTWAGATGWVMYQGGDPASIAAIQSSIFGAANTFLVYWFANK